MSLRSLPAILLVVALVNVPLKGQGICLTEGNPCAVDADCNDNVFCTGVESCVNDACVCGPPPDCDPGFDCAMGVCDEALRSCVRLDFCVDPFFCNGLEVCDPAHPDADAFGCVAGTPPDCDDGVGCTIDGCNTLTNSCQNIPFHKLCDDFDACTGIETCDPVNDCVAGTPVDCDDGISCTIDECDPATGLCSNTPDDTLCDNGVYCDGLETCDPINDCQPGTPVDCDDGVNCTIDTCDEDNDRCENLPDDSFCDDGFYCTGLETCDPVNDCQPGTPVDCEDGVNCTIDACDEANERCDNQPDDSFCDDGFYCTGLETCDPINDCQPGTPVDCDDGVDCTVDTCDDPNAMCLNTPDDAQCDDFIFCNGRETCDPLNGCQPGTNPCPGQVCVELAQECTDCVTANDCDDGRFCNGLELCVAVAGGGMGCVAGPDPCDDGIDCTRDSCDEGENSCTHTPDDTECDDGDACNGLETCDASLGCLPGTPPDCDDGIDCTSDTCDSATGCVHTPNDADCDDGVFCNGVEVCDPVDGCVAGDPAACEPPTPHCSTTLDACVECLLDVHCGGMVAGAPATPYCDPVSFSCVECVEAAHCDDGLACNGVESCENLACVAGTPVDCTDAFACTTDTCVEPEGLCRHEPDDSLCDQNICNGLEQCFDFAGCVPVFPPLECDDQIDCTADSCDPINGCVYTPTDSRCDDGLACNGIETCDPQLGCQSGTPIFCNDNIECTIDSCSEDGGGTCLHAPNHLICDDGLFCTGTEACDPSQGCIVSAPPACPAGSPFCHATTDACVECLTDAHCDDGLACNGLETCHLDGWFCEPGEPVRCDDGADCTMDECLEPGGTCRHTPDHAYCDDDDFCNGPETCEPATMVAGSSSGCRSGEAPDCDDRNPCTVDSCTGNACRHEAITGCVPPAARRLSMSIKGSLLIFSKIELQWAADGTLLQDTLLSISNDYPGGVNVLAYFVNGDAPLEELRSDLPPFNLLREGEPGWNTADCRFRLTSDQPTYWSAARGGSNCAPFRVLDDQGPGRPDPETNGATRVLRGYVVMWAVAFNPSASQWQEIRWNYLSGSAVVVKYDLGAAWEYNAWAFQAHAPIHGAFLLTPGVLELDSFEYDQPFDTLLLDFYGSGSTAFSSRSGVVTGVDTDLTLHPVSADFRQDNTGPVVTKAETEIWNEYEAKFSGTVRCISCWDETFISGYGSPGSVVNHYLRTFLGSDKGKARIKGVASIFCDDLPPHFKESEAAALLGVAAKMIVFGAGPTRTELAGMNLLGSGAMPARILYDPEGGPQGIILDTDGNAPGRDGPWPVGINAKDVAARHESTLRSEEDSISPE